MSDSDNIPASVLEAMQPRTPSEQAWLEEFVRKARSTPSPQVSMSPSAYEAMVASMQDESETCGDGTDVDGLE